MSASSATLTKNMSPQTSRIGTRLPRQEVILTYLYNIVIKHLNWQSCVWLHTLSSSHTHTHTKREWHTSKMNTSNLEVHTFTMYQYIVHKRNSFTGSPKFYFIFPDVILPVFRPSIFLIWLRTRIVGNSKANGTWIWPLTPIQRRG